MSEISENLKYKKVIESRLEDDKDSFCPFRKEKQMDYLFASLAKDFVKKDLQILDACSGYGRLIHFLNEFDGDQFYTGIDYVEELIKAGKTRFPDSKNIRFYNRDVMNISEEYAKYFDISINYKTLSWLPYYETIVDQLFRVTKSKIYITSLFYDGDIDFITTIQTNARANKGDYTYLNTYSFPKFEFYCKKLGAKKVNKMKMELDFDLQKPSDPNELTTYTQATTDGKRLEITGSTILNWNLVEIIL